MEIINLWCWANGILKKLQSEPSQPVSVEMSQFFPVMMSPFGATYLWVSRCALLHRTPESHDLGSLAPAAGPCDWPAARPGDQVFHLRSRQMWRELHPLNESQHNTLTTPDTTWVMVSCAVFGWTVLYLWPTLSVGTRRRPTSPPPQHSPLWARLQIPHPLNRSDPQSCLPTWTASRPLPTHINSVV